MVTPDRIRECFDYDPETGVLRRKVKTGQNCKIGVASGCVHQSGYMRVKLDGCGFLGHRVIWAWMTGQWPERFIDHIDLDKSNNRWANLREATRAENGANRPKNSANTTGKKGVCFHAKRNKFQAQIRVDDKLLFLGRFGKLEEAAAAYDEAARRFFGEFARS